MTTALSRLPLLPKVDPRIQGPLVQQLSVGDLLDDDLLFFRRPGPVQTLTDLAGDRWRHIAIVTHIAGHQWLLEAGRAGYRGRPLTTALLAYDQVAVGRLVHCRHYEAGQLAARALAAMDQPTRYPPFRRLAEVGALSLLRNANYKRALDARRAVIDRFGKRPGPAALKSFADMALCSTLVFRVLEQGCTHQRAGFNVRTSKHEALPDSTRFRHQYGDSDLWVLPDDIWRSNAVERRWILRSEACKLERPHDGRSHDTR